MITLAKLHAIDAETLLTVGLIICLLVVALEAFSIKIILGIPSPQSQHEPSVKNPSEGKPCMPIRLAFIALTCTVLGQTLFAMFAPKYGIAIPGWVFLLLIVSLLLWSSILIKRDRILARCGFAVVSLVTVAPFLPCA